MQIVMPCVSKLKELINISSFSKNKSRVDKVGVLFGNYRFYSYREENMPILMMMHLTFQNKDISFLELTNSI